MVSPPPVPQPLPSVPPPPRSKLAVWFSQPIIIVALALVICGTLFAAGAALFLLTARDFTPTASQKACILTAPDLDNWFSFTIDPASETWSAERYFDQSIEIDYAYDDPAPGAPYLNCAVTIERKLSDAVISYSSIWGGYQVGGNLAAAGTVKTVEADHIFSWGDASHFSFLEASGSNHGFGFIARKGKKIFFITMGGAVLEDPDEVEALLLPVLKRFDAEPF